MRGGQIGFKLRPVFFADPLKRSLIRPETRKCLRRHNEARLLLLSSSFLIVSEFISHTLSARQLVATFTASYKNLNKRVKKEKKTRINSDSVCEQKGRAECNRWRSFHNRCEAYDRAWEHLGVFYRPTMRLFQHRKLWSNNSSRALRI